MKAHIVKRGERRNILVDEITENIDQLQRQQVRAKKERRIGRKEIS